MDSYEQVSKFLDSLEKDLFDLDLVDTASVSWEDDAGMADDEQTNFTVNITFTSQAPADETYETIAGYIGEFISKVEFTKVRAAELKGNVATFIINFNPALAEF